MKSRSFASAIGGAAFVLAAASANAATFSDFPTIGANVDGPAILITLGPGGASLATNPGNNGPYEGIEDAYIGVWNNTNTTVGSIGLSGPGIFGFDGDGIGAGPTYPNSCPSSDTCTPASKIDNSDTGYGGPLSFFSVLNNDSGTVFFSGGLAPGAITWFALEEPPDLATLTVTEVGGAPLPAALPLFAGGLGIMGLVARRRRKAQAA